MTNHPTQDRELTIPERDVYEWHQELMATNNLTPVQAVEYILLQLSNPHATNSRVIRDKGFRDWLKGVQPEHLTDKGDHVVLSAAATVLREWFLTMLRMGCGPHESVELLMSRTATTSKTWELLNEPKFRAWLTSGKAGYSAISPEGPPLVKTETSRPVYLMPVNDEELEMIRALRDGAAKVVPVAKLSALRDAASEWEDTVGSHRGRHIEAGGTMRDVVRSLDEPDEMR